MRVPDTLKQLALRQLQLLPGICHHPPWQLTGAAVCRVVEAGWQMLVEREVQDHTVTALPGPQPCLKSELCWAKAGPDPWRGVCRVPQGSAKRSEWSLLTWVLLPSQDAPPSLCAGPWEVVRECQSSRTVFSELVQVLAM